MEKTFTIIENKRRFSYNPFGSGRDLQIWLAIFILSISGSLLICMILAADLSTTIGTVVGSGGAVLFMQALMLPRVGTLKAANRKALMERLSSLKYVRSHVNENGEQIFIPDLQRWARWDSNRVIIKPATDTSSEIIFPTLLSSKL